MSEITYRRDIQGLRAIAVLAVMAFHFNPALLPGGFIGVDVFLVVSGFLITNILLKKKAQHDYALGATLRYFYFSRLRRIAPAYFGMLSLVAVLAAVIFTQKDFETFKDGLEKAFWFASNHYFADFGDYFAPASHEQPLLHTWSLAVEIQFYLIAPLLVLLLPEKSLKWIFLTLVVGLTLAAEYSIRILSIEQATYYSLYARLPEFFSGCLAALYMSSASSRYRQVPFLAGIGLVLILLAAAVQPALGKFPGVFALLPVMGCFLIIVNTRSDSFSRFLSSKALVFIGALSYSLYLWHWPVLAFLRYYSGLEVLDLPFSALFLILTSLLSIASFYWIEQPLRASARVRHRKLGYGMLLLLSVITASNVVANVNNTLAPAELTVQYAQYADPDTICHGKVVGSCLRGDLSSNREILVLGDSHAAMLNHFFDYLGQKQKFKARIITASGCVTIPDFDYQRIVAYARESCASQIRTASKYLNRSPEMIVVAGRWGDHAGSSQFKYAFGKFLKSQSKSEVYVLSQVPELVLDVTRVRRFKSLGLSSENRKNPIYESGNREIENLVSSHENATFLDLSDDIIFQDAPFFKNDLLYRDKHHLNEVGAIIYAKRVGDKIIR
ncbi:acyltransferase family protein [Marinobacter algicola]|uniref:acyltransferase family protein n=1 Tax=Marinobacter algicola TaxID=236100 RepID=UPI003BAB5907